MRIKRRLIIVLLIVSVCFFSFGQNLTAVGDPAAGSIGIDTAQQKLKEISISKFEDAAFWDASISADDGVITMRRFEGRPADKEPIPDEEAIGITEEDKYVLGIKTEFFRRAAVSFSLQPVRPLVVPGIVKTISVYVAGRNFKHELVLLLADHFGNYAELYMGKLNFSGWKRLTKAVPPTIVQRDYHYSNKMGLKIIGFRIDCDIMETYGSYYIYFDDLRANTDLFAEETRDPDDMVDAW